MTMSILKALTLNTVSTEDLNMIKRGLILPCWLVLIVLVSPLGRSQQEGETRRSMRRLQPRERPAAHS